MADDEAGGVIFTERADEHRHWRDADVADSGKEDEATAARC